MPQPLIILVMGQEAYLLFLKKKKKPPYFAVHFSALNEISELSC